VYMDRAGGDFLEQPQIVTGYEDGYTIDLKLAPTQPPKLARVALDAVYAHPLQNGFQAVKVQDSIADVPDYTLGPQGTFQPEMEWFKEADYKQTDVLSVPPPIHVPTPPAGAIAADNQALIAAFDKADHIETCLTWFNNLRAAKWQDALDLFVQSLLKDVTMKQKKRQERRAKEGKDDSKSINHPIVLYLNETFGEEGLELISTTWPDQKNEIECPPKANCRLAPIPNIGNHGAEVTIPAKVNGVQVLFKFEFVHSRGTKIFDIRLTFNHEYIAKGQSATDDRRDR